MQLNIASSQPQNFKGCFWKSKKVDKVKNLHTQVQGERGNFMEKPKWNPITTELIGGELAILDPYPEVDERVLYDLGIVDLVQQTRETLNEINRRYKR